MAEKQIELDQFLKLVGIAETGGRAKWIVKSGEVLVNGDVELRRGRKLSETDVVSFEGTNFKVGDFLDN